MSSLLVIFVWGGVAAILCCMHVCLQVLISANMSKKTFFNESRELKNAEFHAEISSSLKSSINARNSYKQKLEGNMHPSNWFAHNFL
jgi:hypothetical protein